MLVCWPCFVLDLGRIFPTLPENLGKKVSFSVEEGWGASVHLLYYVRYHVQHNFSCTKCPLKSTRKLKDIMSEVQKRSETRPLTRPTSQQTFGFFPPFSSICSPIKFPSWTFHIVVYVVLLARKPCTHDASQVHPTPPSFFWSENPWGDEGRVFSTRSRLQRAVGKDSKQ